MFRAALYTQWKWTRPALLVATVAVFAVPVLSVARSGTTGTNEWQAALVLSRLELWAALYPISAALIGALVASFAWTADQHGEHVYALSLPVPRWHYVLLRWAAGAVLLLIPIAALWIGALFATATAAIPTGLTAYPNALVVRFFLATFVAYGLWFVVGQAGRKGLMYLLAGVAVLFLVAIVDGVAQLELDPFGRFGNWLIGPFGPLRVFNARWLPIDV